MGPISICGQDTIPWMVPSLYPILYHGPRDLSSSLLPCSLLQHIHGTIFTRSFYSNLLFSNSVDYFWCHLCIYHFSVYLLLSCGVWNVWTGQWLCWSKMAEELEFGRLDVEIDSIPPFLYIFIFIHLLPLPLRFLLPHIKVYNKVSLKILVSFEYVLNVVLN